LDKIRDARNLLFVVGPLRSGTTLLRLLLDHHPEINMFGEFEGAVSQAVGDDWPDLDSYRHFVETDRMMQDLDFKPAYEKSYPDLVRDLLMQKAIRKSSKYIGASVHSRIDLLPLLWPEAKFISLLRDPRDVARSCIGMGWVGNVYEGAKFWLDVEAHRKVLKSRVPVNQILDVRYEDLVTNPAAELTRICDFMGLEFSETMLNLSDTTYKPPAAQYANQWRSKLSVRQLSWVESRCGELMLEQNYELSNGSRHVVSVFER
jgi:hypothetical protein